MRDLSPRRVRFDDAAQGLGFEFVRPERWWLADSIDEVCPALDAAQRAALAGRWVVGFVSYEAASAFDDSFPAPRTASSIGVPLAWFASFDAREQTRSVDAPAAPIDLSDVSRRGGSEWFRRSVDEVRERIADGDVYQVNLTDRLRATIHGDPFDLYRSMVTSQGGAFNAFLDLGEVVVASASPELFLRVEGDRVTARPMKGTRRRHGRPERDRARADDLVHSEKDRAENVMIVDLLRNDLSRLAVPGGVTVPDLFRVERYDTVWQMTSTVVADLQPHTSLIDLFRATFPCGSITGAPKVAAMRVIDELEPEGRGLYCGAIGMIAPGGPGVGVGSGTDSVWSVAIRTAVVDPARRLVEFGAGGGITADSSPTAEDDELEAKTLVLRGDAAPFALFETLRLDAEGVHHLDRHLARLAASAAYFDRPCDPDEVRHALTQHLELFGDVDSVHRLRITLDADGSVRVNTARLDDAAGAPVRLAVSGERVRSDDPYLCHKTTRRRTYDAARAAHPEADDVILVNERGEVVETTIANLLFHLDGRWWVPPLESGGLPGIGRAVLLDAGEVGERVLLVDDLATCDGFAVVNSLRGRRSAAILTT